MSQRAKPMKPPTGEDLDPRLFQLVQILVGTKKHANFEVERWRLLKSSFWFRETIRQQTTQQALDSPIYLKVADVASEGFGIYFSWLKSGNIDPYLEACRAANPSGGVASKSSETAAPKSKPTGSSPPTRNKSGPLANSDTNNEHEADIVININLFRLGRIAELVQDDNFHNYIVDILQERAFTHPFYPKNIVEIVCINTPTSSLLRWVLINLLTTARLTHSLQECRTFLEGAPPQLWARLANYAMHTMRPEDRPSRLRPLFHRHEFTKLKYCSCKADESFAFTARPWHEQDARNYQSSKWNAINIPFRLGN